MSNFLAHITRIIRLNEAIVKDDSTHNTFCELDKIIGSGHLLLPFPMQVTANDYSEARRQCRKHHWWRGADDAGRPRRCNGALPYQTINRESLSTHTTFSGIFNISPLPKLRSKRSRHGQPFIYQVHRLAVGAHVAQCHGVNVCTASWSPSCLLSNLQFY